MKGGWWGGEAGEKGVAVWGSCRSVIGIGDRRERRERGGNAQEVDAVFDDVVTADDEA